MHFVDAIKQDNPTIADKVLVVATDRDGLTGNWDGRYMYQVVGNATDYQVQEILLDKDKMVYEVRADKAVVVVENGNVLYMDNMWKDYLNGERVRTEPLKEGDNVEKKVLYAFREFTKGRFGFGWNIFLEDVDGFTIEDIQIGDEPTPPPVDPPDEDEEDTEE